LTCRMTQTGSMEQASTDVDAIIPVYRERPEAIRATLEALLAQEHALSKIYLVDDGSPNPVSVPDDLLATQRICLTRLQKNAGVSAARNLGIGKSKARFLVCVDSEILLAKNWVAACCSHFASHPQAGVVYTRMIPDRPERLLTRWRMRFQENRFPVASGKVPFAPGHALMFRREAIERIGGFNVHMRCDEDSDVCFRIGHAGWETHFVAESECLSIQPDTIPVLASKDLTRSNWESPDDYSLSLFILLRTRASLERLGRNLVKLRLTFLPIDLAVWAMSIKMAISRAIRSRPQKT
jgi:cellulose synthase/poly-beta-1,6-N-acetylglucosamine synthase-like glycosyltransferase